MSPCPTKNCPLVRQISRDSNDILRNCVSPLQINSWLYSTTTPFNWGKILIKRCITVQTTYQRNIWYLEPNLGNQMHHFLDLFAICIKQLTFSKPFQAIPEASKRGPKARCAASYSWMIMEWNQNIANGTLAKHF